MPFQRADFGRPEMGFAIPLIIAAACRNQPSRVKLRPSYCRGLPWNGVMFIAHSSAALWPIAGPKHWRDQQDNHHD
jgi:hypothetical protein